MKRLRENICSALAEMPRMKLHTVLHNVAQLRPCGVTRAKFDLCIANGVPHLVGYTSARLRRSRLPSCCRREWRAKPTHAPRHPPLPISSAL
jgi:hypothetical protein